MRCFIFEHGSDRFQPLFTRHGVGLTHLLGDQARDSLSVLLEVVSHAHDSPDNRTNGGFPFVFKDVLQSDMPDEVQRFIVWGPIHLAQPNQGTPLQEMRVSSDWKRRC